MKRVASWWSACARTENLFQLAGGSTLAVCQPLRLLRPHVAVIRYPDENLPLLGG